MLFICMNILLKHSATADEHWVNMPQLKGDKRTFLTIFFHIFTKTEIMKQLVLFTFG